MMGQTTRDERKRVMWQLGADWSAPSHDMVARLCADADALEAAEERVRELEGVDVAAGELLYAMCLFGMVDLPERFTTADALRDAAGQVPAIQVRAKHFQAELGRLRRFAGALSSMVGDSETLTICGDSLRGALDYADVSGIQSVNCGRDEQAHKTPEQELLSLSNKLMGLCGFAVEVDGERCFVVEVDVIRALLAGEGDGNE